MFNALSYIVEWAFAVEMAGVFGGFLLSLQAEDRLVIEINHKCIAGIRLNYVSFYLNCFIYETIDIYMSMAYSDGAQESVMQRANVKFFSQVAK